MQLHHAVVAVRDLRHAIDLYRDVIGLDARPGGRHAGRGTENAVVRFRDSYIELLSLFDVEKEISVSGLRGQVLADFLKNREGGLVGYCLATETITRRAEQLRNFGLDVPQPLAVSRALPSGHILKWHVLLVSGVNWRRQWPFLIEADPANADNSVAEPPRDHPLGATGVAGVAVAVSDLARAKELYAQFGFVLSDEDRVPEYAANRARFAQEDLSVDLLSPTGAGPVRAELDTCGEGVFQLLLRVADLRTAASWLARSGIGLLPAPGYGAAHLIPPERALGARFALIEDAKPA
jgi:catechol 2,3-dioxygenase-like lactoylglutathione lyase family enzyme